MNQVSVRIPCLMDTQNFSKSHRGDFGYCFDMCKNISDIISRNLDTCFFFFWSSGENFGDALKSSGENPQTFLVLSR